MNDYTYQIVITRNAVFGGYTAQAPALLGCYADGDTVEEARENIREAIRLHLESLRAEGEPIPEQGEGVHIAEIDVRVPV